MQEEDTIPQLGTHGSPLRAPTLTSIHTCTLGPETHTHTQAHLETHTQLPRPHTHCCPHGSPQHFWVEGSDSSFTPSP